MSRRVGGTSVLGRARVLAAASLLAFVTVPSLAQSSPPDDGGMFQWATVGAVNNPAYNGTPNGGPGSVDPAVLGRGSVSYEFRIARTELTHAQLLPFYQALYGNAAVVLGTNSLGLRANWDNDSYFPPGFTFPQVNPDNVTQTISLRGGAGSMWANVPVRVTWREAALYCNWMHNDRALTPQAFLSGAYDTSTWGDNPNGGFGFTDAAGRMPGARFWIPSISEHMKASHYDPNRFGPNQGGYWLRGTSSDTAPIFARPAQGGQALLADDMLNPTFVGMFPTVQSPWGLLDVAGGWGEWLEDLGPNPFGGMPNSRSVVASSEFGDRVSALGSVYPHIAGTYTLRIASAVPSPSSVSVIGLGLLVVSRRRR